MIFSIFLVGLYLIYPLENVVLNVQHHGVLDKFNFLVGPIHDGVKFNHIHESGLKSKLVEEAWEESGEWAYLKRE